MKNKYVVKILIPNRDKLVELLDALPSIDVEVSVVGQEPIVRAPRKPTEERASATGAARSRSTRRSCSGSTMVRRRVRRTEGGLALRRQVGG